MANEEGDKTTMRGYVYLMDDGRDLKLGITSNMKNRLRPYITENPRLKVHDSYEVESFKQAEEVEKELIEATEGYRTHGKEWCKHCDEVFAIWEEVSRKYAKRTYDEWLKKRKNNEINKSMEVVFQDIKEKFDGEFDDYFFYKKHADYLICKKKYFNGTFGSARDLVFDWCRNWFQENNSKAVFWESQDLGVVQNSEYTRLCSMLNEKK